MTTFSGLFYALVTMQSAAVGSPSQARAVALRVEHLTSPLGIDAEHPRFSWQMADRRRGARQTGYLILVATAPALLDVRHADIWNSGLVSGSTTLEVAFGGRALRPRQRYYWTVCIRDGDRNMAPCATPSWFETGQLGESWRAGWIAASLSPLLPARQSQGFYDSASAGRRPPLLRKSFVLRAKPTRARIYVTALGGYRVFLNGTLLGPAGLAPDWTDYRTRLTYRTYDVTKTLHPGLNAIGVLLGAGWYASPMLAPSWDTTEKVISFAIDFSNIRGPPPVRLLLELHVSYATGQEEVIASDSTWRTAPSPILFSEIYAGETYDGRLEQPGWAGVGFDEHKWSPVVLLPPVAVALQPQAMPAVEQTDSIRPLRRWSAVPGTYVFDLGQNIAGWAQLRVRGPAGLRVQLRFAEILAADSITINRATSGDTYVLSGGGLETFAPHFTYHGFRYVEVTGYPGVPSLDDLLGIVVHTALPITGDLTTSSPDLNRLWKNILWTQRANVYSVMTDCPQRGERLGWLGDAQVFWPTASYNMDMVTLGEKWLADMRDGQSTYGCFPNVAPNTLNGALCGSPGSADAGVTIPWGIWRQYGDSSLLARHWRAMERYLAFIRDSNPDYLWRRGKQVEFSDWMADGSTHSWGLTSNDLISTAFWAYDASLMAQMARALGKDSAAADFEHLLGRVRAAFDSAYILPDGRVGAPFVSRDSVHTDYTQTASVLALRFGLVPERLRERVVQHLVDDIAQHDWHLTTGFLGSAYVLPALSDAGRDDVAFRLLLTKTFPSWLYMVARGATTIWERWNGDRGELPVNSQSHNDLGSVGEWLYRYLAGIDQEPGSVAFDSIAIRPRWDASLDSVRAVYHSARGTIASAWQRKPDGSVVVTITIPANTTGRAYLPATTARGISAPGARFDGIRAGRAVFAFAAGSYRFTVRS